MGLPVATLINESVLILHGGIPAKADFTIADIEEFDRMYDDPPRESLFEEILWSDPCDKDGITDSERGYVV